MFHAVMSSWLLMAAQTAPCPAHAVHIPGPTTFEMGGGPRANAQPAHKVTLDAYCLDRTEVTVRAFHACVTAGKCDAIQPTAHWTSITPAQKDHWSKACHASSSTDALDHPVNCVTHAQATTYCAYAGGTLPTEAQWELAARGPSSLVTPWGDAPATATLLNACDQACQDNAPTAGARLRVYARVEDGFATTAPVGRYPQGSGPYGVQDLLGNVREWVQDRYGPFVPGAALNPTGPAEGPFHVTRGAGWNNQLPTALLATFRTPLTPEARHPAVGFRCAYPLKPGP